MLAMVTDDLPALAEHKALDPLECVLQASGRFDREPGPDEQKDDQKEDEDQKFHRERIRNRSSGILWLKMQHPQKRGDRRRQQMIQDVSEPELFRHESFLTASSCLL